jgi:asparagine synthase (glutamine-hydrolysing)
MSASMFLLFVQPGAPAGLEAAAALRGGSGAPRCWSDAGRGVGAAAMPLDLVPEDRFDAQPYDDGRRLFVAQVRLDNREEVVAALGLQYPAREWADSAVLAAAYDRWGLDCVDRIVGDYVFASWHRDDGRVEAAVDPLGVRRLYWTAVADGLLLSTQMAPLLAHRAVSAGLDLHSIARLLDFAVDRSSTPFVAVRAVPGGHLLRWKSGQAEPRVSRWWNPSSEPDIWYRDPNDYVAETRALFDQAVRARLRSSGPLSATLSGGLDSGSVTATAARMLPGVPITAYTSVPEAGLVPSQRRGWIENDWEYAAAVAANWPTLDHRAVCPNGRSAIEVARQIHAHACSPTKSSTNLLWLDAIAMEMREQGSRVLLTGQRGNAAFSWLGESTVSELARLGRFGAALRQVRSESAARGVSAARVVSGNVRTQMAVMRRRAAREMVVASPANALLRHKPTMEERGNEYALPARSRAYWAAFAATPTHSFGPEAMTQWSVEFRDPTSDRRLTETLLRYPQAAFRADGRPRGLARAVAEGLLPDAVRLRTTSGAQVPEAPSLIAHHATTYRDAIAEMRASPACLEMLDISAIEAQLDAFIAGDRDYYRALGFDRACDIGCFLVNWAERA